MEKAYGKLMSILKRQRKSVGFREWPDNRMEELAIADKRIHQALKPRRCVSEGHRRHGHEPLRLLPFLPAWLRRGLESTLRPRLRRCGLPLKA